MNRQLRKLLLKSLNSGFSANNIYSDLTHLIYNKVTYNKIGIVGFPEDSATPEYNRIRADIERIIKVFEWDINKILENLNNWVYLK